MYESHTENCTDTGCCAGVAFGGGAAQIYVFRSKFHKSMWNIVDMVICVFGFLDYVQFITSVLGGFSPAMFRLFKVQHILTVEKCTALPSEFSPDSLSYFSCKRGSRGSHHL